MDPIFIDLKVVTITWYAVFMITGFCVGIYIAIRELKHTNLTKDFILDYAFYAILFGIIGARIWYVLFDGYSELLNNPLSVFAIWNGGLAIHGGITAGLIVTLVYANKHRVNPFQLSDLVIPGLLFGQSLGRFGNFVNQEAHGGPTTYEFLRNTLHLPEFIVNGMCINGIYYQPTFLYESVWNLFGFILVMFVLRPKWRKNVGMLTAFYLMWYGFIRVFIEMMRTDALMFGPIKVAQLASVVMFIAGAILMAYFNKRRNNE